MSFPRERAAELCRSCVRKAWERGKRCNDYTLETFRRSPVGSQSHLVEPGKQPEASLALAGATRRTKRRQPGRRPCYRAPKSSFSQRAHRLNERRGRVGILNRPGVSILPGSKNRADTHQGSPGTGETCYSPSSSRRPRSCRTAKLQAPPTASGSGGSEASRCNGGIVGRAQELGETGWQESEGLIVPGKPANAPRAGPVEGRGAP